MAYIFPIRPTGESQLSSPLGTKTPTENRALSIPGGTCWRFAWIPPGILKGHRIRRQCITAFPAEWEFPQKGSEFSKGILYTQNGRHIQVKDL